MLHYRLFNVRFPNALMNGARYLSANTKFEFHPNYRLLTKLPGVFSAHQIQNEQGLIAASPHFARKHGGEIMNQFLDAIPDEYVKNTRALDMVNKIDCRIHNLEPGDYPAQPGWHCDGSYSINNTLNTNNYIVCTFSDSDSDSNNTYGVSNTQFLKNKFTLFGEDPQLWEDLNAAIEKEQPEIYTNHDGQMIEFDSITPHRAQPATQPGWRMFVRMSMWPNIYSDDEGRLTHTNNVYRASSPD